MEYFAAIISFGLWNMATGQNQCMPKDCFDLRCFRLSKGIDGPHTIYPEISNRWDTRPMEVSCNQEARGIAARGGGWIMWQRRVDGQLNFSRPWAEYTGSGTTVAKGLNCGWGTNMFTNCC